MWKIIEINMNTKREYIDVIAIWDVMMIFHNEFLWDDCNGHLIRDSESIVCDAYSVCLHASTPLATSSEVTRK